MNTRCILMAAVLAVVGVGLLVAADAPATKPAAVATVGSVQIMGDQIDVIVAKAQVPADAKPEDVKAFKQKLLGHFIQFELLHTYLDAKKVACPTEELEKVKKEIEKVAAEKKVSVDELLAGGGMTMTRVTDQLRERKFIEAATTDALADEYIKAHPAYFNGTTVRASHILIACEPLASTEEQKAAIKKLEGLAAEINSGKLTFAMAATLNSSCPSKAQGGDLGEFSFEKMVPPFAKAAFEAPVGGMTGVVHTQFGYHLIKVTEKKEAKTAPGDSARNVAKMAILSDIQNDVLGQALAASPIVILQKP